MMTNHYVDYDNNNCSDDDNDNVDDDKDGDDDDNDYAFIHNSQKYSGSSFTYFCIFIH